MKTLLTGGRGFLGRYFLEYSDIINLGRSSHNDIVCDLAIKVPAVPKDVTKVIHAAGLAHLNPKNKSQENMFYDINVEGTNNLIKGLQNKKIDQFIFISSVAVYGLTEGTKVNEKSPLIAKTPYGKSKIEAERLLTKWATENHIPLLIIRLPLIAGKNAPGNLGHMLKAINKGYYVSLTNSNAKKSIVLASDVAKFCVNTHHKNGIYNLTDMYDPTILEIENYISKMLSKKIFLKLPKQLLKTICTFGDLMPSFFPFNSNFFNKINLSLTFETSKAVNEIGWRPSKVIDTSWD